MPNESPEGTAGPSMQPTPPTLNHVVGQKSVIAKLKVALDASFADNQPFPHTLLLGPPGLGKTTLAKLIATELAAEFHEGLAQTLATPAALNGFLLKAEKDKAVLFIDECHELPPLCQTSLYKAMEEGAVFLRNQNNETTTMLKTARFTLIAATTDPQHLLPPLVDRFKLVGSLQPYSESELVAILRQRAHQLGWLLDDRCLPFIAMRAFGTPRLALRLLESSRRTARADGSPSILLEHLLKTINLEELDVLGLGPDEQRYMAILFGAQAPMRLGVLASKLRVDPQTVSRVIESKLVAHDLIERTPQGRTLTVQGIEHVRSQREGSHRDA